MNKEELKITQRALQNILNSMIKSQDAPCSAEMHLMESVVDLARILGVKTFKDEEMNQQFAYCTEIMDSLRNNIKT